MTQSDFKFHNTGTAALADEYGTLKGQADAIELRLKAIKSEMIARKVNFVEGDKFTVTIAEQSACRLDTTALKAALGAEICSQYEKVSLSTVVRVKPTVVFGQVA